MCNLYSITTNQAAIAALFRVVNRYEGNLRRCRACFLIIRLRWSATPTTGTRDDYDAMGHAAAAEVDVAASYEYPQHVVTALARLAEAGEPLLSPVQQLRGICAEAEP